jgi:hypothetical protein
MDLEVIKSARDVLKHAFFLHVCGCSCLLPRFEVPLNLLA